MLFLMNDAVLNLERQERPPLDPARFRGDALAGIAVGLMFAAVAGLARSAGWDWLSLPCFIAAGAAFYLVGFRRAR